MQTILEGSIIILRVLAASDRRFGPCPESTDVCLERDMEMRFHSWRWKSTLKVVKCLEKDEIMCSRARRAKVKQGRLPLTCSITTQEGPYRNRLDHQRGISGLAVPKNDFLVLCFRAWRVHAS